MEPAKHSGTPRRKSNGLPRVLRVEQDCQRYFEACDEAGRRYTRPGLALALGVDTETLAQWQAEYSSQTEMGRVLRRAMDQIVDSLQQRTDAVASLLIKQAYQDRQPVEQEQGEAEMKITVCFQEPERGDVQ